MRRGLTLGLIAAAAAVTMAATAVVAVVATGAIGGRSAGPPVASSTPLDPGAAPDASATPPTPAEAAASFLADWVQDGRVVRRDQGGDTVSEGQAYGLLAAVVAHDEDAFDAIWDWTSRELVRPDGLLAWRWQDGAVVDDQPASDADLDAARALVLAGTAFDRPDLTARGTTLAGVVMDRLTVTTDIGRILLPGLWAAAQAPYAYNPSYASPVAFAQLAAATGDPRWNELEAGTAAVTTTILAATALPPDWAQVHPDGQVDAMPGPGWEGALPVQYGYDAARLVLRYAESCRPADVALAARVLPTLDRSTPLSAVLDLGGGALGADQSALAYSARAAAAGSAGEAAAGRADLARAARVAADYPTYYGQAWAVIGSAMLTSDVLGGCGPLRTDA